MLGNLAVLKRALLVFADLNSKSAVVACNLMRMYAEIWFQHYPRTAAVHRAIGRTWEEDADHPQKGVLLGSDSLSIMFGIHLAWFSKENQRHGSPLPPFRTHSV